MPGPTASDNTLKILVTAGPTREPIDPVRYISNRSSGKMGYAIAAAALHRGHAVRLVSGPVAMPPPAGATVVKINTAAEMLAAVRRHLAWCDILIMAAAVADWRPAKPAHRKIKKSRRTLTLRLIPTADILRAVRPRKGKRIFAGFAAETSQLCRNAQRKLVEKGLDYIFANDVSRADIGFDADDNEVIVLAKDGTKLLWPRMKKTRLAQRIIRLLEKEFVRPRRNWRH